MTTDDRLLKTAMRAYERQVERLFEAVPLDAGVLPVIGEAWPFECVGRDVQKQAVVRALAARQWFEEFEGPPWSRPLLLDLRSCRALLNNPGRSPTDTRRDHLRGGYGLHARSRSWHIEHLTPFEVYCAYQIVPLPPSG